MASNSDIVEEKIQHPFIERQMEYVPSMNAREYIECLRSFNVFYGYSKRNINIPLPENVPDNITIQEYYSKIITENYNANKALNRSMILLD
jgi:hypothetical protein